MLDSVNFTVERRTGRLVEARIFRLTTPAEVIDYGHAFTPALIAGRPVLLADHRPVAIYHQAVAAKLLETFNSFNRIWERVAIIIAPTNATLFLQFQRVVREARNPSRRIFTEPEEACDFIAETLQPLEMARASAFLDMPPKSARSKVG